jgi:hypothetical protein
MKKYLLLLTLTITNFSSGCPWQFSPNDSRPFFEQYEKEIITQPTEENENKKDTPS